LPKSIDAAAGRQLIAIKLRHRPQGRAAMTVRIRKLIGALALIALVCVWSLVGMAIAQFVFSSTNSLAATIYYVVIGLGWVLPAMPIVSWMQRPDSPVR
jgi:hypothetical protein